MNFWAFLDRNIWFVVLVLLVAATEVPDCVRGVAPLQGCGVTVVIDGAKADGGAP